MTNRSALPRVVVLISHMRVERRPSRLAVEIQEIASSYEDQAVVTVVDLAFENSLAHAQHLQRAREADALICAGATGAYLRKNLGMPVVLIRPNGLDLLRALSRGRSFAERVAVLSYRNANPELEAIQDVLSIAVEQRSYTTRDEAQLHVRELAAAGQRVVIGSSMATEIAEEAGLVGLLAIGSEAVRQALDDALALCRAARAEVVRRQRLDAILRHLRDGVLAASASGRVLAMNPAMAVLLGTEPAAAIGRDIDEIVPGALDPGQRVLVVNGRSVVVSVTPLPLDGERDGSLVTVQDADSVQRAYRQIGSHARKGRFVARHDLRDLAGDSAEIRSTIALAQRYARSNAAVLVTGETGTGKELVAQGIHNASPRRSRPFVGINCGAFPESLLESELFGYEEGAFTGSRRGGKPGLFEVANGGTLFLDEIGDVPLPLQTRLLRVLQEREVLRLGGTEPTRVDVRVIAATNRDLRTEVASGRLREDLYYRLNVLRLHIPPLRERPGDIELLARAALERTLPDAADGLLALLLPSLGDYRWPGNVRELENVVERAAVWWSAEPAPSAAALRAVLPELGDSPGELEPGMRRVGRVLETTYARQVVSECGGSLHRAAERLGVSRSTLWRRLRESM